MTRPPRSVTSFLLLMLTRAVTVQKLCRLARSSLSLLPGCMALHAAWQQKGSSTRAHVINAAFHVHADYAVKVSGFAKPVKAVVVENVRASFRITRTSTKLSTSFVSFAARWSNAFPPLICLIGELWMWRTLMHLLALLLKLARGRKFTCIVLPGVKLTLEESGEWYNIFENRRRGLADKPLRCGFCGAVFKCHDQFNQLRDHIIAKHSGGPALMDHKFLVNYLKDAAPDQLKCDLCMQKFSSRQHLERHIGALHYEESFSCVKCSKVFKQKDNYRSHLKTH